MRKLFAILPAALLLGFIPARADVIPPGTNIEVRPDATIDVSHWDRGRIYPAHVARDVIARDGDLAIPRGAEAELIVRQTGPGQFVLDLESITVRGQRYAVDSTGQQFNMPREQFQNGSGVLGAIAGAIAGANGERIEPRGAEIRVPEGSMVTFQLQQPMRVVNWRDPGYMRDQYHYHRDNDWYR